MVERERHLRGRRARRERRQVVTREEGHLRYLARLRRRRIARLQLAQEPHLPGVERPARAVTHVAVEDADQLDRPPSVTRLLAQLLLDRSARALADLGPPAGRRPEAVVGAAYEQ